MNTTTSSKSYFTTETQDVRKNPFMLREPQHERDGIIDNSKTYPLVLSGSKDERRFFLTTAEFTEIRVFLDQELFTLRPEPVLSDVEGRPRG